MKPLRLMLRYELRKELVSVDALSDYLSITCVRLCDEWVNYGAALLLVSSIYFYLIL